MNTLRFTSLSLALLLCSCGSTEPNTPQECRELADRYLRGIDNHHLNPRKAVRYYSKAATMGDAEAQERLGDIFSEGRVVEQDGAKAVHFYTQAAESWKQQGSCRQAVPLYKLGLCHELGKGVKKDIPTAINYYRMASQVPGVTADIQSTCPAATRMQMLEQYSHVLSN